MNIVREEVEVDDRLLERSDFLRVQKRKHDRVAVARWQGEIEYNVGVGPAGVPRVDPDFGT